jgi:membrane protein
MDLPRTVATEERRQAIAHPRLGRVASFVVNVVRSFYADDGVTWAAGMAFYLVLSIPPLLIGLSALAHVFSAGDGEVSGLLAQLSQVIPGEGGSVQQLAAGRGHDVAAAGILALAWILVSGSRVFGTLVGGITAMWDVPRKGSLIARELLRFALLAAALIALVTASLVSAVVGDLGADRSPLRFVTWLLGAQILPVVLVGALLALLYRFVPPDAARWRAALAGAIVATVLLRVVEFAFLEVFAASSGWQTVYGPLAGVALLMTWGLATATSVVLGAEVVILIQRPDRIHELGAGAPGEENRTPRRRRRNAEGRR